MFGLATDYCVKATALDAKRLGFKVAVVTSLSHGVDPQTTQQAIDEMEQAGIAVIDGIDYNNIGSNFNTHIVHRLVMPHMTSGGPALSAD